MEVGVRGQAWRLELELGGALGLGRVCSDLIDGARSVDDWGVGSSQGWKSRVGT